MKRLSFIRRFNMFLFPIGIKCNSCNYCTKYQQYQKCNTNFVHVFYSPLSIIVPKIKNVMTKTNPIMNDHKGTLLGETILPTIVAAKTIWLKLNNTFAKFSLCLFVSFINYIIQQTKLIVNGFIVFVFIISPFVLVHSETQPKINVSAELKNLKSKNMAKKLQAVENLAKSKDKTAVESLKSMLKTEKNLQVKTKIVESFAYCHNKDTLQEVVDILKTEKAPDLRLAAVYSLGYAKDSSVVPLLIQIFLDENETLGVRLQSANALVNYPATEEIYNCFINGLKSEDVKIKTQSIVSLAVGYGSFHPEKVIPILKDLANDKDETVSKTAKQYLEFLGVK